MKTILLHPSYFPSIEQMAAVAQAESVVFEVEDNYQKQTYRNRAYIAHSNGRLLLNVPIKHSKDGTRQQTKDVVTETAFPWQDQHWKSLQTAYRTSPYFEFYEDELAALFDDRATQLLAHNIRIFEVLSELIELNVPTTMSMDYETDPKITDLRQLAVAKAKKKHSITPYIQVFQEAHGFLHNLSVLDLLFNEGPNTLNYLETLKLNLSV